MPRMHPSEQKSTGLATSGNAEVEGRPGACAGRRSLSLLLLLVVYPLLIPLGTYPVLVGGTSVSAEFLFSILCVLAATLDVGVGRLRIVGANRPFLLGLALWLGANYISGLLHPDSGVNVMMFRTVMKALFGYMVFVVLTNRGRLDWLLKAYLVGCAAAGVAAIVLSVQAGGLIAVRQASYGGLDPAELDVSMFRGFARAGAGNLLPFWICLVLGLFEPSKWNRRLLFIAAPYFLLVSLLALRREVLVEFIIGCGVLFFAAPTRRNRVLVGVSGLILACGMTLFVARSESWQDRLASETRQQFEAGTDPRWLLIANTPAELMQAPLLGHGPGSYVERMSQYLFVSGRWFERGTAAHNSFSRAAVETGTTGLVGLSLLVAATGWRAIRSRSKGMVRLLAVMVFLHVSDWLFFGDGIGTNVVWFFIGVSLVLDRILLREEAVVGHVRWTPKTRRLWA